jgi:fructose-bisphosphate aldolase class II
LCTKIFNLKKQTSMAHNIKPGVATGDEVQEIFQLCKRKRICSSCGKCNWFKYNKCVIETAAKLKAPVIIQFSNGGAQFNAGKGLSNANEKSAIA